METMLNAFIQMHQLALILIWWPTYASQAVNGNYSYMVNLEFDESLSLQNGKDDWDRNFRRD